MYEPEIVASRLVVPRSDAAKALQAVEEDLDQVSSSIEFLFDSSASDLSVRVIANHELHALAPHFARKRRGIVSSVSDECSALCVLKQFVGDGHLVSLAGSQRDVERAPFRVDEGVEFC